MTCSQRNQAEKLANKNKKNYERKTDPHTNKGHFPATRNAMQAPQTFLKSDICGECQDERVRKVSLRCAAY